MRHLIFVLSSLFVATLVVVGVSAVNPSVVGADKPVKKCGGGKISLNPDERKTFYAHNKTRRDRGLKTFCVHPKLQRAARAHSKDMVHRDYFSHDTKGGATFDKRLKKFGYTPKGFGYYTVAENIAYGSGNKGKPELIMKNWMNSRDHKKNVVNGKLRQIGVGTHTGTYKKHRDVTMYTADFGTRR